MRKACNILSTQSVLKTSLSFFFFPSLHPGSSLLLTRIALFLTLRCIKMWEFDRGQSEGEMEKGIVVYGELSYSQGVY